MEQRTRLPTSLEDVKIKSIPATAYYIADFISEEEEQRLVEKIGTAPKPRWKQLTHRRLQTWPSDLHGGTTLLESPLPQWLTEPIVSRVLSCPVSDNRELRHIFHDSPHGAPNHVLINEYLPGQGIMPHKDGPAYHPVVCTVSLRASLCLDIYGSKEDGAIEDEPRWKILQEPRSLLITTGELYTDFLHGIAELNEDVNLRPATISNFDLLRSPESILKGEIQRQVRTSLTSRQEDKGVKKSLEAAPTPSNPTKTQF